MFDLLYTKFDKPLLTIVEKLKTPVVSTLLKPFSLTPKAWYVPAIVVNFFVFANIYWQNILLFMAADIAIWLVKRLIKRERPEKSKADLMHLVLGFGADRYSFPSAHSFTAFQFIPLSVAFFGSVGYVFGLYSVLVGLSRIFLKYHFPSDVIGGAILGVLLGALNLYMIN